MAPSPTYTPTNMTPSTMDGEMPYNETVEPKMDLPTTWDDLVHLVSTGKIDMHKLSTITRISLAPPLPQLMNIIGNDRFNLVWRLTC